MVFADGKRTNGGCKNFSKTSDGRRDGMCHRCVEMQRAQHAADMGLRATHASAIETVACPSSSRSALRTLAFRGSR